MAQLWCVGVVQAYIQPACCALKLFSSKLCPCAFELSCVCLKSVRLVHDPRVASLPFPIALLHTVRVVDGGRCRGAVAWNSQGVQFLASPLMLPVAVQPWPMMICQASAPLCCWGGWWARVGLDYFSTHHHLINMVR